MIIFKRSADLSTYVAEQKKTGRSVGFVPTMGALHAGHLSLIALSKAEADVTISSLFVNPTQFNNPDDFRHYPVTIEKDIEALISAGCDVLFLPSVAEVYPPDYKKKIYELGYLETVLEGAYRPGHYQGVCQVVDRLLSVAQPNHLYLGQKDFQQCMVIKKLVATEFNDQIDIHIVPTVREADGLAMSSRNMRLTADQRALAPEINRQLRLIASNILSAAFPKLEKEAGSALEKSGFVVDYISIRKAADLSHAYDTSVPLVVLAAASIGDIRLIDNVIVS